MTASGSKLSAGWPDRGPWPPPQPPLVPEPPRRTEPVLVPTVAASSRDLCPRPDAHYACETVTGVEPATWEELLRRRYVDGYRLMLAVPAEGGQALLLFEHAHG